MEILYVLGGFVLGSVVVGLFLVPLVRRRNGQRQRWERGVDTLVAVGNRKKVRWLLREDDAEGGGALLYAELEGEVVENQRGGGCS
jgi:hypothetical protein